MKILHACKESTVTGLRTKSLRSLSTILSADSSILTKVGDWAFFHHAASREAACFYIARRSAFGSYETQRSGYERQGGRIGNRRKVRARLPVAARSLLRNAERKTSREAIWLATISCCDSELN